jgi:FHS family L-fucose permease-like MFS transporter
MWSLIAIGLCHSVMFPTIFTLGIRGLGPLTEEGSGLLIMAIAGGAFPRCRESWPTALDYSCRTWLPAACYVYVLGYALWGCRSDPAV